MKMFLLAISIILLAGCAYRAEGRDLLQKSDSIGQIVYDKKTYYVVKVADLKKARKGPPTYVGSIKDYHLFRVWLKILDVPDEISFFAVKKGDCTVEDKQSPEEEEAIISATRKEWRKVGFENEKCFVRKR